MLAPIFLLASLLAPSAGGAPTDMDPATLARALAERNAGNAIVLLNDGRTVNADPVAKEIDLFADGLKKSNVRYVPGPVALVYSETLPEVAMYRIAKLTKPTPVRRSKANPIPLEALKAGKITFASEPGTKLDILSLEKLSWSLPLSISPAFTDALAPGEDLAISVKELDGIEFLRALAKALGGRFQQNGKELRIEPIGSELKNRALATIALAQKDPAKSVTPEPMTFSSNAESDGGDVQMAVELNVQRGKGEASPPNPASIPARLEFARTLTQNVPPVDFERLMSKEVTTVSVDLRNNTALQAAIARVLQVEAGDPAGVARVNRTLADVNLPNPGVVRLSFGYTVEVALNVVDRRGRAIRTLTLRPL